MNHTLYQEIILDHFHHPRNHGHLSHPTHHSEVRNSTCGDLIEMDIQLKHDTIIDVRFSGAGCALSQASASLLTEHIKGMSRESALSLSPETVLGFVQVPLSPSRTRCALLSLETLHKTLQSDYISSSNSISKK